MKIKRVSAVVVLVAGAVGAFLITRGAGSETGGVARAVIETGVAGSGLDFQKVGGATPQPLLPIQEISPRKSPGNLTNEIVEAYTREVLEPNFSGALLDVAKKDLFSVPSEEEIESIVEKRFSEPIDFQLYRPESVKVTENNLPERQRKYLLAFGEAYENDFGDGFVPVQDVLNKFMAGGEVRELLNQMAMISRHIASLLALETPAAWKEFHLKNLNNWRKRFVIYEAISKIETDPVRALVASREIESLMKENEELRAEVTRRFGEFSELWKKEGIKN